MLAEHGLNPAQVPIGHQWNDRMNAHYKIDHKQRQHCEYGNVQIDFGVTQLPVDYIDHWENG
jgi:hypothetical protein